MKKYVLLSLLSLTVVNSQADQRIVGGVDASPTAYPMIVALISKDSKSNYKGQFCGGSLIAPDWVLTASHCIISETPDSFDVVAGVYDLKRDTGQRIAVKRVIAHPNYNINTLDFDIALVQLKKPVTNITPVALNENRADSLTGVMSTVVGWGNMSADFDFFPHRLQEVQVPIVSNQDCKQVNAQTQASLRQVITDNKLCAGYISGGKDACQGDSGGPLLIKKNDRFYLAGVVSSGNGCALPLAYGVYTRVANFASFIDKQIHIDYLAKADINQDGIVDNADKEAKYLEMQNATRDYVEQCWLTADQACGDLNGDKKIDWRDLSKKTANLELAYNTWLETMWRPEQ